MSISNNTRFRTSMPTSFSKRSTPSEGFVPHSKSPATAYRFEKSFAFLKRSLPPPARLLDLGPTNPLADMLREAGYEVLHTTGDLDDDFLQVESFEVDAVTAFEILEHLVAPLNVLRATRAPRLFASIPLRLWFAPAYRNLEDPWDRHYHEFESWQFDWLLEKAQWEAIRTEKWKPKHMGFPKGIRPLLRRVTPRWYAVEAIRAYDTVK